MRRETPFHSPGRDSVCKASTRRAERARQQPLAGLHTCSGATSPGLFLKQNTDAASTALGFAHTALPWEGTPVGEEAETSQSPPSPRGQTAPDKQVVRATGLLFTGCVGQTPLPRLRGRGWFHTP